MSDRLGFDPTEARRLIDQVQLLGAHTARTVVDRFARMVEALEPAATDAAERSPARGPYEDAVVAMIDAVVATARAIAATVDVAMSGSSPPSRDDAVLRIRCRPGESAASASMWIHNTTSEAVLDATVRVSDLVGAADRIAAGAVRFDPADIPVVAPRESVEIVVTVDAGSVPSGAYGGLILIPALADLSMKLIVSVEKTP